MFLRYHRWAVWGLFGCIVLVFFAVRVPSLMRHDVAYTYDQARDFLLGARIIVDRHLVFIGPTTGIGGLFHGAWWYYFTALSYLVLGSDPIRYYIAICAVHAISLIAAFIVIKRLMGSFAALTCAALITVGDYFIGHSLFVGNNIMAMPAYLGTILSIAWLYLQVQTPRQRLISLMCLGLSIGFVAEFELAFGLFLIPTFAVLFLIPSFRRLFTPALQAIPLLLTSVSVAFLPRLLFELKNHFIQTHVLLGFVTKPKYFTPKPFTDVLHERIANFDTFMNQAFTNPFLFWCFAILFIIVLATTIIKIIRRHPLTRLEHLLITLTVLHTLLFCISLEYKDTFWSYYFEGIQYGFIMIALVVMSIYQEKRPHYLWYFSILIGVFFLFIGIPRITSAWRPPESVGGLRVQEDVVDEVIKRQGRDDFFCLRAYVPPVIPWTYDYLWFHHYIHRDISGTPRQEYINGSCWYIIEPDQQGYEFRATEWKKKNIPTTAIKDDSQTTMIHGIELSRYHVSE